MRVIFTGQNLGTMELRGKQVAEKLSAVSGGRIKVDVMGFDQAATVKNAIVIAVKFLPAMLAQRLKDNHNKIIFDSLDKFCRQDYPSEFAGIWLADHIIYSGQYIADYWSQYINGPYSIIAHHWDSRITEESIHDELRIGYIGASFNHGAPEYPVLGVYHPELGRKWANQFNCHWNVRELKKNIFKPATKVVTAAAVGANIITTMEPSSVELLGDDYPYYVTNDIEATYNKVKEEFGSKLWFDTLNRMFEIKEKTSLDTCVKQYITMLESI